MGKRGVDDILRYVDRELLVRQVVEQTKDANIRDRALLSLLATLGLRISELLSITKDQVNTEEDPEFIVFHDVLILKRWIREYERDETGRIIRWLSKRREPIFKDFALPKQGVLEPLSTYVLEHLATVKKGKIFNISRSRAWQIVTKLTGKWCHYYRSQRISFMVNNLRGGPVAAAEIQGIKSPSTIAHYYKSSWKNHKEELK